MGLQQNTGKQGEALAQSFLERKGYTCLATNFRHGKGEIDLIMRDPTQALVFVEVKGRKDDQYGHPESFVSKAQKAQIRRAAEGYMDKFGWQMRIRFDIVAILWVQPPEITHFEDAF